MRKVIANVKRNISNPYYFLEYSVFCLILSILVFGWLSFSVLVKEVGTNRNYLNETKSELKKLQDLKFGLVDLQAEMDQAEAYLPTLNEAIPNQPQVDAFLLDFVPLAGNEGFGLLKVTTTASDDLYFTSLTIELSGNPRNLHKLIAALEKQPRYVSVYSVGSAVTSVSRVTLEVKVFHADPKSIDFTQIRDAKIDTEFLVEEFVPVHERN